MTTIDSICVALATDADNDRYREASRRLADRTAAISVRMQAELERVQQSHEIDWRSLLSSQRSIAERVAEGANPNTDAHWDHEAVPMTEDLVVESLAVVDAHLMLLWDSITAFLHTVSSMVPDATAVRPDVEQLIEPVASARLDRSSLDDLGRRWHERLRRQAIRRYVRTGGARDEQFAAAIDAQELAMLRQPPWAQGDQLLAAFELAHTDVRHAIVARVDRLIDDVLAV